MRRKRETLVVGETRLTLVDTRLDPPLGTVSADVERQIQNLLPFLGTHTNVIHHDFEIRDEETKDGVILIVSREGEPVPYPGRKPRR